MASGLALYVDRVCIGVYALMSQHASAYVSAHSQPSAGGFGQRGAMLDLGSAPDSVQFLSVPSQSSGGPISVVGWSGSFRCLRSLGYKLEGQVWG